MDIRRWGREDGIVDVVVLITAKRLAFTMLGIGLVIWLLLGVVFRKPRY